MARPIKKGIDYFPLDVYLFQDKKIKILKARYGSDGITIYLYLLCEIYKNGYYLPINDDFIYIMTDDLGMKSNKVKQVLNFLLERSLFDDKLFQSDKVLTSTGIQHRFQLAVKERAKKNPVEVFEGFWLLKNDETEPFIKVNPIFNNSQNNENKSWKNDNKSQEKYIKESKEKESRVKESKKGKTLLPEEMFLLVTSYGTDITKDYIERTTQYNCCNYDTIVKWIEEDRAKTRSKPQFTGRKYTDEEMKMLEQKLIENI